MPFAITSHPSKQAGIALPKFQPVGHGSEAKTYIYGLPHKHKRLTDSLALGKALASRYPTSTVDFALVCADMESA